MRRALLMLALLVTLPCLAADQVYRWTDANGVAHFSDAPPPHGVKYKLVDLATGTESAPPAPTKAAPASSATTPEEATPAAPKPLPDTPANRTLICKRLEQNIAVLASDQPLTESPDSSKPMAADVRQQRLTTDRGRFQKYCSLK